MRTKIRKPIETFKNAVIATLVLLMLLLAGIYIGGSQFSGSGSSVTYGALPSGTVKLGADAQTHSEIYTSGLLKASFASLSFDGHGGGVGTDNIGEVSDFAFSFLHDGLASGNRLKESSENEFSSAVSGNFLYLRLMSPLPYQTVYALTGETGDGAASASCAVNMDRFLLSVTDSGKITVYISDGQNYYRCENTVQAKPSELALLAADENLTDYSFNDGFVPVSKTPPSAYRLTLSANLIGTLSADEYNGLLYLLGYNPDKNSASYLLGTGSTVVEPHGTLSFSTRQIVYTAASDGGIAVSDFLSVTKDEYDIDFFDIMSASASLIYEVRKTAPECFGGEAEPYLRSVYKTDDAYTLVFGLTCDGIDISGDAFPYFAEISVQNGVFKSIDLRGLELVKNGVRNTLFPSEWVYSYASKKNGKILSLDLCYIADALTGEESEAEWYCRRAENPESEAEE